MPVTDSMPEQEPRDIRPVVARQVSNRSVWIFAVVAGLGALGLFSALEAQRVVVSSPSISAPVGMDRNTIASIPELAIPQAREQYPQTWQYRADSEIADAVSHRPVVASRPIGPNASPPAYRVTAPLPSADGVASLPALAAPPRPAFAYQSQPSKSPAADAPGSKSDGARVSAARFESPATTVPQGAVIQAVLETALDSTRAGFARAVVSRDVSSFDGSRILIPKGSKLFGEYKSDVTSGQNRALIQWHRLTRPDGAIIDVDSPSADPLGRMGVKGKVNSHFFERFGGAILQSVLDIGVQLAARNVSNDAVILNLPNSSAVPIVRDVPPTLKVRQGTSISVFVGRDLDFTAVEQ